VGDAIQFPLPTTKGTATLLPPKPFLFFDFAITFNDLPFLIPFIVQEVFIFLMVHDLPPAVTLLPVIFEPPLEVGRAIVTVTLTLPFFGVEEDTETIVGAEGFVTFTFALAAGATARLKPRDVTRAMV
jgi:hypothetical protein